MEHKQIWKSLLFILVLFFFIAVLWGIFGKKYLDQHSNNIEKGNEMDFTKITANLIVENVNETVDYYKNIFGFNVTAVLPEEGEYDFAIMQSGDVEIMFQKKAGIVKDLPEFKDTKIGGTITLFIEMEGIKELYKKAESNCVLLQKMHKTFYGMEEFTIKDINGYIITFAERLKN